MRIKPGKKYGEYSLKSKYSAENENDPWELGW